MIVKTKVASTFTVEVYSVHPEESPPLAEMRHVAKRVITAEGWKFSIRIVVVDDPEIRRLNREFLGKDEITDVIAFPDEKDQISGGEIYISLDQARGQALENAESVQKALHRLLVHGILHLGGWNDASDEERDKMIEYGEKYL